MTYRENFLSIARRTGYSFMPVDFSLCPFLTKTYGQRFSNFIQENNIPLNIVCSNRIQFNTFSAETYYPYFNPPLKPGSTIDMFGVGHEPGSDPACHMTYMRNPLSDMATLEELQNYPYPTIKEDSSYTEQVKSENALHKAQDKIIMGQMQCTIWERAWYMRSMEQLMMDMICDEELADYILNYITDFAIKEAQFYATVGVDVLFLGDDIGMQASVMMSDTLYTTWLKWRLKKVIDSAKEINPGIVIFYHSCGYVEPFIPHLIDAGVDVLNPVQPECMEFKEIYKKYGDRLSFHGTIGTQTTMPHGTADEVRQEVIKNLNIAGKKGGLFVCPTHLLEPEVPPENIEAYLLACKNYIP